MDHWYWTGGLNVALIGTPLLHFVSLVVRGVVASRKEEEK